MFSFNTTTRASHLPESWLSFNECKRSHTLKLWMINNQVKNDAGWFPTFDYQSPSWAREFLGRLYCILD